jgi:imidazole glycerol-phosphate synthase subunit HisH
MKVAVVDYGMGNLHSVAKALSVSGHAEVEIAQTPSALASADKIVFPGVGAMRHCILGLKERGLDVALKAAFDQGKPMLAICVGLQSLMDLSEENEGVACLGWFPGRVKKFDAALGVKVPHMGWNEVHQTSNHALWQDIPQNARFYFVHSYYVSLETAATEEVGSTVYGHPFTCAIAKDHLFAVQFHPEKSQKHGLQLLRNFLNWKV